METTIVYNPFEWIEYIPFTGKFAVYRGDNRSRNKPLIGVYETLKAAQDARDKALPARRAAIEVTTLTGYETR